MSKLTNPNLSLADHGGPPAWIANDTLPMSRAAAWPDFLQWAGSARARAHLKAKLTGIQKAHRTGDPQLQFLIQQHLTSFHARTAATRLAASKMPRYRRPKKAELKTIAGSLNAFQGTQEEVRLRLIRKDVNTFRPTLDFGIENRALQHLVLSVLYAIAELHPRQFATRGGVPAAIAQVMNATKAGYVHVREIDIKDFYASFDGNKLVEGVSSPGKVSRRCPAGHSPRIGRIAALGRDVAGTAALPSPRWDRGRGVCRQRPCHGQNRERCGRDD